MTQLNSTSLREIFQEALKEDKDFISGYPPAQDPDYQSNRGSAKQGFKAMPQGDFRYSPTGNPVLDMPALG
jgi:hypothetical protein